MKILVTGSTGFIGSYFIDYVLSKNNENNQLFGFFSSYKGPFTRGCTFHQVNLRERENILLAIQNISPDFVIHYAGVNTGTADDFFSNNVMGLVNLLDAIISLEKKVPTLIIGSSTEYGYQGIEPINEYAPITPIGFYGISKAAATLTAKSYSIRFGLPITIVRLFNVIGPGQSNNAVCGKLVSQISEIHSGKRDCLELSGGNSYRDFIDVRDVVKACWMLLMHDHFDQLVSGKIFNLGSGKRHSISDIIHVTEKITNRNYPVEFSSNNSLEFVPSQVSDNHLIMSTIGWKPEISLKRSLQDMLYLATSGNPHQNIE